MKITLLPLFGVAILLLVCSPLVSAKKARGSGKKKKQQATEEVQAWSSHSGSSGRMENANPALDEQILQLRALLQEPSTTLAPPDELASYWRTYALLLQQKDKAQHFGGGALQSEAVSAFNRALALSTNSSDSLEGDIEIHYHKGILLETMGQGAEAMLSYEVIVERATGDMDRSIALGQMASVLCLLDRSGEAVPVYRRAIAIAPLRLEVRV